MNSVVQTLSSLMYSTRPASMRFDTASGRCALSTASALSTTAWLVPKCRSCSPWSEGTFTCCASQRRLHRAGWVQRPAHRPELRDDA